MNHVPQLSKPTNSKLLEHLDAVRTVLSWLPGTSSGQSDIPGTTNHAGLKLPTRPMPKTTYTQYP